MNSPTSQATRLLIMGPPGSGKGTQASLLSEHIGIPAISTGEIFRAIEASNSPESAPVRAIMQSGGYIGDEVTAGLVADRLSQDDCRFGFLLDGYPRTLPQVETLDALLGRSGQTVDAVISLVIDVDDVNGRLLKRADIDGRADDNQETINVRQRVYAEQTAPLLDLYRARGLLVEVDGGGPVQDVAARILTALGR
ncbi:MAG TPA: adenylate kinase [Propionibacteriaceae bacterium]|nr:adenylate kinase [Propionibacteriaceae bacterium]